MKGESAIILRSDEVFKRLEHVIYNNYELPSVNRVVDDALCLILKRRDTFLHQKQISGPKLDRAKLIVIEANEHVQGINNKKQQTTGGTSQIAHPRVNTSINTNAE